MRFLSTNNNPKNKLSGLQKSVIQLSIFSVATLLLATLFSACDGTTSATNTTDNPKKYTLPEIPNTDNIIKFVAMGDVGTGDQGQYDVATAVKTKCDAVGCDFVILLGDNIYESGVESVDDAQFQTKFEMPYNNINLPFFMTLGNHDYGNNGLGLQPEKGQREVDYSYKSNKWVMPDHYYHFTVGNTELFSLDTHAQFWGLADNGQKQNVTSWLNESTAAWKIVFGHHPYKSNGTHGNAGEYDGVPGVPAVNGHKVKEFAESVWCGKADIYLSGHDHSRQWLEPTCQGTQLVVSGAGAKITDLPGGNIVLFQANTIGFLYIEIDGDTLSAEFINAMGDTEFSHTITKAAP